MEHMHMPDNLTKAAAIFSDAIDIAEGKGQSIDAKVAFGLVVLCRALTQEIDDMRTEIAAIRQQLDRR